jgi:hypothetical protein
VTEIWYLFHETEYQFRRFARFYFDKKLDLLTNVNSRKGTTGKANPKGVEA